MAVATFSSRMLKQKVKGGESDLVYHAHTQYLLRFYNGHDLR